MNRPFVVSYLPEDGRLDPQFGTGGISILELDEDASSNGITIDFDQAIIVGEITPPDGDKSFLIVRLTRFGALASEFGDGGIVQTDLSDTPNTAQTAWDVKIVSERRLVVVGEVKSSTDDPVEFQRTVFKMALYSANGSLLADRNQLFGEFNEPGDATAKAVTVDGVGNIYVTGPGLIYWRDAWHSGGGIIKLNGEDLTLRPFPDEGTWNWLEFEYHGFNYVNGIAVRPAGLGCTLATIIRFVERALSGRWTEFQRDQLPSTIVVCGSSKPESGGKHQVAFMALTADGQYVFDSTGRDET